MTTFDASAADQDFQFSGTITPTDAIDFSAQATANATTFSWRTSTGHLVTATGAFTYPAGVPTGTVTSLVIDLGEDADNDIAITGVANADIALLIAGHDSFWQTLFSGGDTFIGAVGFDQRIDGDSHNESSTTGSNDTFTFNFVNGGADVYGDQFDTLAGATVAGGDDTFIISGSIAATGGDFHGDTATINAGETYFGGDDAFTVNTSGSVISIRGDASSVYDTFTGGDDQVTVLAGLVDVFADASGIDLTGVFIGGDDIVVNARTVYGDGANFFGGVFTGGNDNLSGGSFVYGDLGAIAGALVVGDSVRCGDDAIATSDSLATLYGDIGTISGDVSAASVVFGNDTMTGGSAGDTMYGDFGVDTLGQMGDAGGADIMSGGGGADTIYGQGGDDIVDPGDGDDTVVDGGAGSDTISYASMTASVTVDLNLQGAAQATGAGGADTLTNFENILGGSGNDALTGDGADNVIEGGDGADVISGAGNGSDGDTASYARATAGVTVSLAAQGAAQDTVGAGSDTLTGFENIIGSVQADNLSGDGGANTLTGGGGGDTLNGAGGVDTIHGGDGGDDITGGGGADTLSGDAGDDIFHQINDGAANTIDGGDDTDTLNLFGSTVGWDITATTGVAGATTLTLTSIENVIGGILGDRITGSAGANILEGRGGRDELDGGLGVDQLFGGGGEDRIVYDALDDLANVLGGAGDDTLVVVDMAAPTTFNLYAHEFEFADILTNDTGSEIWQTNTWTYDQSWRATQQTLLFDDLTTLVNGYDLAGLLDWTEDYDAAAMLVRYTNFDQDGTEGEWTSFYDLYSAGVRTQRFVDYDNGTSQREGFDASANVLWRQEYDATDALIRYTEYDVGDLEGWTDYYNLYVSGVRTQQYMSWDDGTAIRNGYDSAGNLDWVEEYSDAGITRSRYVDYDQASDQTWTYAVTYYDINGVQTSRYILYDDGSELYL